MRCPEVEPWERAAAGIEEQDRLRLLRGLAFGLAISFPIDVLLVWAVLWLWK